jgi:hypothetical protein
LPPTFLTTNPASLRANEHPKFPDGGKMSQHLDSLALGDEVEVKGPVGHFVYTGRGTYTLNNKPGEHGLRVRQDTAYDCFAEKETSIICKRKLVAGCMKALASFQATQCRRAQLFCNPPLMSVCLLSRPPCPAATAKRISLIAGGTGITPCWQVIRSICEDPEDTTQVGPRWSGWTPGRQLDACGWGRKAPNPSACLPACLPACLCAAVLDPS